MTRTKTTPKRLANALGKVVPSGRVHAFCIARQTGGRSKPSGRLR